MNLNKLLDSSLKIEKQKRMLQRWLKYFFNAKTIYKIDSPFVYDFAKNVLEDDRWYYAFDEIEDWREALKEETEVIEVTDFGAGSKAFKNNERKISKIAKTSLTSAYFGRLLFRLIQHYKPKTMLEFGTSLGITTMYQALSAVESQFITMEGCPNTAGVAMDVIDEVNADHVQFAVGDFDKILKGVLDRFDGLDYVFFDGNHKEEPTVDYFKKCLPLAHNDSIFIFDDIHWSEGMEAAWERIKKHESVTLTIDLFQFGIVLFRKEQKEKQHFTLIESKYKPWIVGLKR